MSACKDIVCLWMGACKYPLQTWQDSDVTIFEISVNIKGTSECTCDTVLPERHQENWVWLCRRVKPHTDFFFSNKPNVENAATAVCWDSFAWLLLSHL